MLLEPRPIKSWAVVNFSFPCDSSHISRELISCGMRKGIVGFVDTLSIFIWCVLCSVELCLVIYKVWIWFVKSQEIDRPFALVEEDPHYKKAGPVERVEKMIAKMKLKFPDPPHFILCVLPERKTSDIYGIISPFPADIKVLTLSFNWSLQTIKVPGRRYASLKKGSTHNASAQPRSMTNISQTYFWR